MTALALPLADLGGLKRRVATLAEPRPAVYRMIDARGRVIYVGKAKRLRPRLLSYFRAVQTDEKAGRILRTTSDIAWEYQPSEFAACLAELRLIQRHRPPFNVHMNRMRRLAFIKVSRGPAPKIFVSRTVGTDSMRHYGPFPGAARLAVAVRVLNDLLGLRDCALHMPIVYPDQGDLFGGAGRAACPRYDFGTCSGPCGGLVGAGEYARRVEIAMAFLENRGIAPLDRVIDEMEATSAAKEFEHAARWRDRFEALEWLLAASVRARAAVDALTFVYAVPGAYGDDRAYVICRGTVRGSAPVPHTPIERAAFSALVRRQITHQGTPGPLLPDHIDETLLLLSWFRRFRSSWRRTTPLEAWVGDETSAAAMMPTLTRSGGMPPRA